MPCEHGISLRKCKICKVEYNKMYSATHREELNKKSKIYYFANKENYRRIRKQWRAANKEVVTETKRKSYLKNRLNILNSQREYGKTIKNRVMAHYGNGESKCVSCGFSDINALSIDHVNGNGSSHRKEVGSGGRFYHWLIRNNYPLGFQVLCYNCNWLKRLSQQIHIRVKNEKKNKTTIAYFLRTKLLVFQKYSGGSVPVCNSCGNANLKVLSIDHLYGKGTEERRRVGYGNTFYIWLFKNSFPEGYQVLCLNCQMIKRAMNKEGRKIFSPVMKTDIQFMIHEDNVV